MRPASPPCARWRWVQLRRHPFQWLEAAARSADITISSKGARGVAAAATAAERAGCGRLAAAKLGRA